ncbi:receptor-type tyrosine-protein phosphatase eta-like isoform X2 [Hippocampus zosterae]|uniref:receptor-type tyrosine-protein phosphatase eta-like isoform X2 n=1 Tax=Hippocampus zosterae TaxID=109293 RepID=UPI00223CBAD4|nr:receptor-type tyrosine-protein phosphatase eta-like isoform X2 [Hippocampus zosterae]
MKTSPLRVIASLWTFLQFSALIKGSHVDSIGMMCDPNETIRLITTTTTTVTLASPSSCFLSLGNISGNDSLTGLTPGAIYQVFLNCFNCSQKVTMKPQKVTNLEVNHVTTSSITVSWTKPEGNYSFYRVQWTDGKIVQKENVTVTSQIMTGLSAGTMYNVNVTTLADDGMTEGDSETVSVYTIPGIIREPSASTNTSAISLKWKPPDGEVFVYRVEWHNEGAQLIEYTNDNFAVLSDLVSGTSYPVKIVCIAGDNQTEGEPYKFAEVTRPERPENIMATAGTENLKIEWTLQKGKADFYEVNISNADLLYSSSNKTLVTTAHFHDLYPGRVFLITVTAVAGNLSSTSTHIAFATIPTPPGSLNITQRTTTSLHLRWETPTKMQQAPFISYHITYQRPGGKMQTTTTINNSMVLSQLSSGTEYNISVYTIGPQNLTSSAIQKSAYTFPNPVLNLVASPINTTSINVAWSFPHGVQTYFSYLVQTRNSTGALVNEQTISDNISDVHDLEPGTKYSVSVTTLAAAESESTEEQTFAYTMPRAVTELKVKDYNTTAIQLTWFSSSDYKDTYSYLLIAFQDSTIVQHGTTKTQMYTFYNLIPGTLYSFEVFTVVEGLNSTLEHTSQYTKPGVVSNIRAIGTTTNMSVFWSAPMGRVDSYTVLLNKDSECEYSKEDLSNSTLSTLFQNLKPGVLYCVVVISKSGPLQSDNSTYCNATFPNPPGPISIELQTVSSINFTWGHPDEMDQNQYKFSVNDIFMTENTWFLLKNLTSGSPYSISVATLGVMDYKSTEVMANNYTRPYSVTMLKAAEITTNAVILEWEQPENKLNYSYLVRVTNGSFPPSEVVSRNLSAVISGLFSGYNYTFTVFTQAADGTLAIPRINSFFTRPHQINELKAHTINSTAIQLLWVEPLEHRPEYTYRVETTGCSFQNKTVTTQGAVISELNPGTLCTFCVFVQAGDGIEGKERCIPQYTMPEAVQLGISSQGSNMSVLVSWIIPAGNVELYSVHLNSSSIAQSQTVASSNNSLLFKGLSAGRLYSAKVISHSGPFNVSSEFVTNATFPNPPGPIEIITKSTTSIEARWTDAPQMNGTSFFYQLTIAPPEGSGHINTTDICHTFEPLLSGTPYNISIATIGVLGFRSDVIHAYLVTTKPLHVKSLNTSTEEESITVTWVQPDEHKESYLYDLTWQSVDWSFNGSAVTDQTMHTITNLVSGSRYNFSVITETQDGTQGAPRRISACTDASPVRNAACKGPDNPKAEIVLTWTEPRGQFRDFRITMNNTTIMTGPRTCNQSCSQTISNLSHYTSYNIMMETLSCGQTATPVSLYCRTGITDPPIPENYESLASVNEKVYNRFTIQINSSLIADTSGPVTNFGVLVTENIKEFHTANMSQYLEKTYQQWIDNQFPVYLATVKERNSRSRSQENMLSVEIGDGSQWKGYTNGALRGNRRYQFAIVLFTRVSLQDNLIKVGSDASKVSITKFYPIIKLPQDPVVITVAVGATLGIFSILFIILIGFIVYWKRLSKKESSDIQIHSLRSAAVSVEDYDAYYKKQKADSNCGFAEEFEDLRLVGTSQSKACALIQENKAKNRYNNVLPYDSSRVKLSIIHGSPYDDYINANYMPGYNSKKEFIAAQGPLASTVKDFWRMIWEKNVYTLVMLTRCNEQGRIKCEQYWHSSTRHFEYIRVTTTSEIPLDDWTIRDFEIKNVKTAETRSVRQFHFTAWPDHGVPETTELLISFRHLVREHMDQYSTNSPTVVHCSAGVGRTGTFIAIDRLIFQIERENVVDVYGVVHDLRMHRPLMVQTEDQYVILNQCAMDIIRSRTGTNVDLIYQNTAALSIYENVQPRKDYYKHGNHNP